MSDLINRNQAIEVISKLPVKVDNLGYTWMIAGDVLNQIAEIPSAEPELEIIRCADCKWWDRLEEGHPYGDCRACRSGTQTERWEISIHRQNRYDFYCADAEPKENEDDDE